MKALLFHFMNGLRMPIMFVTKQAVGFCKNDSQIIGKG